MIYTFYSFKGGVGRSMALANTAELLCSRGVDVLVIDFDLEAPGLERFFATRDTETPYEDMVRSRGVVDLILSYKTLRSFEAARDPGPHRGELNPGGGPTTGVPDPEVPEPLLDEPRGASIVVEPFSNFIVPIYTRDKPGRIWLMPAGRRDDEEYGRYAAQVSSLDLADLYRTWGGQQFFDWFIAEAKKYATAVLIDSRTGITEMSGVCTHHLADAVVLLVAPNEQNIEGAGRIIRSLEKKALVTEGRRGRDLSLLVVPSRVENGEGVKLDDFAKQFEESLSPHIDKRLSFENSAFVALKIPYVTHYAYGEEVAARDAPSPKAADLVAAYSRMTAALVQLAPTDSLLYQTYHSPQSSTAGEAQAEFPSVPPGFVGRDWAIQKIQAWLRRPAPQVLLVTGAPGAGKSALAAKFLDRNRMQSRVDGAARVAFFWKCEPWKDSRNFVTDLARSLAAAYPLFLQHLNQIAANDPQISLRIHQRIGLSDRSSQAATLQLQNLHVGLDAGAAFAQIVVRPLQAMYQEGFARQMVIVIDELDAEPQKDNNLISLLSMAPSAGLPQQVRLLLFARKDVRIFQAVSGDRFDIVENAPESTGDVIEFARERLSALSSTDRELLAAAIGRAAGGNFLVARAGLEALPDDIRDSSHVAQADKALAFGALAEPLTSAYQSALNRTLSSNLDRWQASYRPLLAVLAVARVPLSVHQVVGVLESTKTEVVDSLRAAAQFVTGNLPDGPFGLFHPTFAEYLFRDPELGVDAADFHRRMAAYFIEESQGRWSAADNPYGVRHTVYHLLSALRLTKDRRAREDASATLTALLTTYSFIESRIRCGDIEELRLEVEQVRSQRAPASEEPVGVRAVAAILERHAKTLAAWNSEGDPDLFANCVRESAGIAIAAGLDWPLIRTAATTHDSAAGNGTASGETLRSADLAPALEEPDEIPDEVLVEVSVQRLYSARRIGALWLMVAIMLCSVSLAVSSLPRDMLPFPKGSVEIVSRNLYVLIAIVTFWGAFVLRFRKESLIPKLGYAWSSSALTSALAKVDAMGRGHCYRLIGSVYAGSPNFEIAALLYGATFVLLTVPEVEHLIRLFQLQRPT